MSLPAGARLGVYEILSFIGAGGMGEVYRARDSRLDRTIAIKILPAHLAASPELRLRFEREARTISQFSHPHICAVYDVGRQDAGAGSEPAVEYLVMELLEGETLQQRLTKGALPLEQALRYGAEIADALDAAHRHAVVHRDLKPGNVMLTRSGVKLLDFGLAKTVAPLAPVSETALATSPPAVELSQQGTIAGTLQYMSPEQLEGRPADGRSDIFALGAILYEMATGRKAFAGSSPMAVASAILSSSPPPMSSVQPLTPVALDRLVRTCLAKDPDERWQHARDVALQLGVLVTESGSVSGLAAARSRPAPRLMRWTAWVPWAISGAAVVTALLLARRAPVPPRNTSLAVRFALPVPPGAGIPDGVENVPFAVSPDGVRLVFVASTPPTGRRLWLRPWASADARPLDGTEGASAPFWSPDGRSIAFFTGDKLKRLDLQSGAPVPICDVRPGIGLMGTWGLDAQILFASIEGEAVYRVSTAGGPVTTELKPDRAKGEARTTWPQFLPDGRRFWYLVRLADNSGWLTLVDPGHPPRRILSVVSAVSYVDPGYLVYAREGTLVGQRFDVSAARVTGDSFSIADPVRYFQSTGWAPFAVSQSGVLVYQPTGTTSNLVWLDRGGHQIETIGEPADYARLRISPDGRSALLDLPEPGRGTLDVWSIDLARGFGTRLTSSPETDVAGTWLPDGRSILYAKATPTTPHVFRRDLSTGTETEFDKNPPSLQLPEDVSPDGRFAIITDRSVRGMTAWVTPVEGPHTRTPLVDLVDDHSVQFSRDGRFIAFSREESGRPEVYVALFSGTSAASQQTRVSARGGRRPRWSRDGREIFYIAGDGQLMAATVRTSGSFELGPAVPLFDTKDTWADYDLGIDGKRILAIVRDVLASRRPLSVVVNWPETIGR